MRVGWRGWTLRALALRVAIVIATPSLAGCLTESTRTHTVTVPRGYHVAPPVSLRRHVTVFLSHASGKTQVGVYFTGECALFEVGERRTIVERKKHVSALTVALTGLLVGSGMAMYMLPDGGAAEEHMTIGSWLLVGGAVVYGIPAIQQKTVTTRRPSRPAARFVQLLECPVSPVKQAEVLIRDVNGERSGTTDSRGAVLFDGEPGADLRVFVDGQPVTDVRRQLP
jgi:hypothetical protein